MIVVLIDSTTPNRTDVTAEIDRDHRSSDPVRSSSGALSQPPGAVLKSVKNLEKAPLCGCMPPGHHAFDAAAVRLSAVNALVPFSTGEKERACGSCRTCGRTARVHKVLGKARPRVNAGFKLVPGGGGKLAQANA